MKQFLTREMSSRLWNPKWIEGMKKSGYSGARQMAKEVEHLYGLRATAPSSGYASVWQQTFDVYVADKHNLGMDGFFAKENPHARQMLAARLLEVDRQGVYRFSAADRKALVRSYIESVNRAGVSCYANACDNKRLISYVTAQAGGAVSASAAAQWRERMNAALTTPRDAKPAMAARRRPLAAGGRTASLRALFPSMRIFEVSEGKLRVVGREVGWMWVMLGLALLAAGSMWSLAQRRMDSAIVSLLAAPEQNPAE
jgi:cobalamin biosynthesis Mg chelatase CobN